MYLENISIVNYKNLEEVEIDFSSKLNCFIGDNGAGKTNLLDAVYYLSFCKSFFNYTDLLNIRHNEQYFMLRGKYIREGNDEVIACGLQKGQKKQFKRNAKVYSKLADHIGLIPLVMITPSDVNLIIGGSDERRKFVDGVISQFDGTYLRSLLNYNKALVQRNNLLKQFASGSFFDEESLSIWDMQLVEYGNVIHRKRKDFIEKLIPVFQHYYSFISKGNEEVGLIYHSDLKDKGFEAVLKEALPKDRIIQYTTVGVHKEDLLLSLNGFPIKKFGSQGQKKTYLAALKLAQFEFIKEVAGIRPILLLDDIFDKLDRNRVEQIINLVADDHFGQIFITDTNREHLDGIVKSSRANYKIFKANKGTVKELK
ncbi:MAG: DNA replication/repair protein RecF [Chlorobi bacterium]|nr:DNA replication/repair protein RecF [Chlorobiota bacterium]